VSARLAGETIAQRGVELFCAHGSSLKRQSKASRMALARPRWTCILPPVARKGRAPMVGAPFGQTAASGRQRRRKKAVAFIRGRRGPAGAVTRVCGRPRFHHATTWSRGLLLLAMLLPGLLCMSDRCSICTRGHLRKYRLVAIKSQHSLGNSRIARRRTWSRGWRDDIWRAVWAKSCLK